MPHFQSSMRRRFLSTRSSSKPINGNVGDAVFFDGSGFLFVPYDDIVFVEGWTPIGVVVIPTSHNVYGDGTCGITSLVWMNCNTPDSGSTACEKMYFGNNSLDTDLFNYTACNYIGTGSNLNNNKVQGTYKSVFLPTDAYSSGGVLSLDGVSMYYNTTSTARQAPSPYNLDGSRNESYYTTAYSTDNAFSDFKGYENSLILTSLAGAQSNWKTATKISNNYNGSYYPGACCCWRFHTQGTNQGDWYLPAMGELGYMFNRLFTLYKTIAKISEVYNVGVGQLYMTTDYYMSSTETSEARCFYLKLKEVEVTPPNKNLKTAARAFLRL